ncbi:MucBP domain-containing protein [Agrilactobacillus yilanensis]|uniref:MucBP domain-containing protein n=1 Tax=Agrilactobacillus yilanensis TaxID=2485997 RepID=A0ABW4JAD2_9LACO|nr:MucBP domain-containing protein [Agrilactobacillus yilanensis]
MIRTPNGLRQKYFKRKKKQQRVKASEKKRHLPSPVSATLDVAEARTEANTRIIPKTIDVTIHYVDSLGRPLLEPVTVTGPYQSKLTIPWQTIPSYILASIHHFQKSFLPNPHGIYLIYAKQTAAPVVVYHRDNNGNLLSPPEFLHGHLNSAYAVKPLSGMQQFMQSIEPQMNGTFTKKTTQIDITYETMQLSALEVAENTYVQLLAQTRVFSQPDTTTQLEKPLPKASIWRIYQAVKEKTNGRVWFNLGGFIWIIAQDFQLVNDYRPKLLTQTTQPLQLRYQIISEVPIQKQAVVNTGHDTPVTMWSAPYGQTLNYKLYPGEVIFIQQQIQLDNHSLWSQLDNGAFIESKYISYL